ncbi:hypothetical protein [Micromonospora sp. LOL_024]|uniref:hypothetical protein n=1 Tax=Micromonospora sp. LOL_024 TaxID=3345412 RepID=UPI003A847FCB
MEDGDLPDASGDNVVMPAGDGAQVQVADGAAGEAAELQVDQAVRVGNPDRSPGDRGEVEWADALSVVDLGSGDGVVSFVA